MCTVSNCFFILSSSVLLEDVQKSAKSLSPLTKALNLQLQRSLCGSPPIALDRLCLRHCSAKLNFSAEVHAETEHTSELQSKSNLISLLAENVGCVGFFLLPSQ